MNILANEAKMINSGLSESKNKEKFVKLFYQKKVITKQLSSDILTKINGDIQRVIVTYKKLFLKKFK